MHIMSLQKQDKLNQLIKTLPDGFLANAAWLEKNGYSRALRNKYVKSGWLEQPAHGVFRRPGGPIKWQHVVISLQSFLDAHPFVGGRTALELHGFSHYVAPDGLREIHLYNKTRLPGWLNKVECPVRFIHHNSARLFNNAPFHRGIGNIAINIKDGTVIRGNPLRDNSLTQQVWGDWDWPITLSTPERAILELLDEVPGQETFHQADMIMESLGSLSPRRLQGLLEDCRSVKVKRLFLWFSRRHGFRYLNNIKEDRIDLGSGKRSLVKGGHLDPQYLITVPEDMHADR